MIAEIVAHGIRELVVAVVTMVSAADVACAESGYDYQDGAAVLQVVRNRAGSGWGRYDGTLYNALWSPKQHAHHCRWPISKEHLQLGAMFTLGTLGDTGCDTSVLWYCGKYDRPGSCRRRGARSPVIRHRHTFYR